MKLKIRPLAGSFSDRWIKYCGENHVPYTLLNRYDFNIQLADFRRADVAFGSE